jgi:hypothetical protein
MTAMIAAFATMQAKHCNRRERVMATNLVVRNIDPSIAQALKEAVARHG